MSNRNLTDKADADRSRLRWAEVLIRAAEEGLGDEDIPETAAGKRDFIRIAHASLVQAQLIDERDTLTAEEAVCWCEYCVPRVTDIRIIAASGLPFADLARLWGKVDSLLHFGTCVLVAVVATADFALLAIASPSRS